jgi:hypothetical protein
VDNNELRSLILAAIYAVGLKEVPVVPQLWLKELAFTVAFVGSALLLRIQYHMAGARLRLDEIEKAYFAMHELKNVGLTKKEITKLHDQGWWAHWWRGLEFTVPLILVLWVGAILVCLALQPAR